MNIDRIRIPIEQWQIEEILEKRIHDSGVKIEDLFLVWSSAAAFPDPGFYDTNLETKFGKLRVFFTPYCPANKSYVLHRSKFNYPRKGNFDHFDRNGDLVN